MSKKIILAVLLGCLAGSGVSEAAEFAIASVPVEEKSALASAPESERAVRLRVDGFWYTVGVLHHHWNIALAAFRVSSPEKNYDLRIAFNPAGELVELAANPPEALPEGLAAACRGLNALSLQPGSIAPGDPRAVLRLAARAFYRSLQSGSFERALQRRLRALDAVTGATP